MKLYDVGCMVTKETGIIYKVDKMKIEVLELWKPKKDRSE